MDEMLFIFLENIYLIIYLYHIVFLHVYRNTNITLVDKMM